MTVTRFAICKAEIITAFCGIEFLAEVQYGIKASVKCTSVFVCSYFKTFSLLCKYLFTALIKTF